MKVLVTGGTGFIGNHVIEELLKNEIEVVVTSRSEEKASYCKWFTKVKFLQYDISTEQGNLFNNIKGVNKLIHLAWDDVSNCNSPDHFEVNLIPQYNFIKKVIKSGVTDITIAGTCLEYGMKSGCLSATTVTDPQNPYALAKDTLRKFLQQFKSQYDFRLKWVRLFYMYGLGQPEKSIIPQLEKTIRLGEREFKMSGGEQLRDYLPVEKVAEKIVAISKNNNVEGIINCCSGKPISIRNLVENYLRENNKTIHLNLGYYPYPNYEPMAFWGESNDLD